MTHCLPLWRDKPHESRDPSCLIHPCIPSTQNSAWDTEIVNGINTYPKAWMNEHLCFCNPSQLLCGTGWIWSKKGNPIKAFPNIRHFNWTLRRRNSREKVVSVKASADKEGVCKDAESPEWLNLAVGQCAWLTGKLMNQGLHHLGSCRLGLEVWTLF